MNPSRLLPLAIALITAAGCAKGPIVSRPGDAWQCGAKLRQDPKADHLLGWLSVSSVDRWIAAVDRIGQRAGVFAPDSSVRTTVMNSAQEKLAPMGVRDLRWLDTKRPIHLLVQHDTGKPQGGLSAVVPVVDHSSTEDALKRLRSDFKAEGHDLVIDLKKAGGKGQAPLWIDWLDHATALVAASPERKARALSLARCVEVRQPRELLHVGVSVADLASRYKAQLDGLLKKFSKLASMQRPGSGPAVANYWRETLSTVLTETDAAILMVSAGQEDVRLGLELAARPGSNQGRSWGVQAKLGANPVAAELPADAWLAATQSYDVRANAKDLERAVKVYAAMFQLSEADAEAWKAKVRELLRLAEPHSGFAMFRDGRFPLGMYGAYRTAKPERVLQLSGELVLRAFSTSVEAALAKVPMNNEAAEKRDAAFALMKAGWGAIVDKLLDLTKDKPVRVTYHDENVGGLRCRTLRVTPDKSAYAQLPPRMRMARMFVPSHLDGTVCTGRSALRFALAERGPQAIAKRVTSQDGGVGKRGWYKAAAKSDTGAAQLVFGLHPGPLVAIAKGIMPRLPDWPAEAALVILAQYRKDRLRWDLRVPVAIADFVRSVRGGDEG